MIRAKLCAVKPLIYCILLSHTLFSCLFAYQEQDLETLADKLQFDEKLDEADEKIINKLWQKYVSGNRLTLIEDDTVYKYEKWMNRDATLSHHRSILSGQPITGLEKEGGNSY